MRHCLAALSLFICLLLNAQVQVDQFIDLTGPGGQRAVRNLEAPLNETDAVNKAYVDNAVSASGGASVPTMVSSESSSLMNYGEALRHCNALSEGGFTDWRMPTWQELQTVVSTGGVVVSNNTSSNFVWVQPSGFAWSGGNYYTIRWMRFSDGTYGGSSEFSIPTRYTRCVR